MDIEKAFVIDNIKHLEDENKIQRLAELCDDITHDIKGMSKRNIIACIKRMDYWGEFTRFLYQISKQSIFIFKNEF